MKEYIKKIVERSNAITCTDAIRLYDNEEYFCLYENGKEISVGIGKYIEIYATENFITNIWKRNDKEKNKWFMHRFESVIRGIRNRRLENVWSG